MLHGEIRFRNSPTPNAQSPNYPALEVWLLVWCGKGCQSDVFMAISILEGIRNYRRRITTGFTGLDECPKALLCTYNDV